MDFFEAQERARRRSRRLVSLFLLAVAGTVLATYAAALLVLRFTPEEPGTGPLWDPGLFSGVAAVVVAVVGFASLYKWSQMRQGGGAVAEMVGGRRVSPDARDLAERRLLNVVEEMAIASGVPVPSVYVLDEEPGINAFAAGLSTADAAVAVTRGALEKLTRDELQGVIAHEFSHILNGDMRLNVRIAAVVFGILALGLIGRGILRGLGRGRIRTGGGRGKGGGIALAVAVGATLLVIGYIGYFFGRLIQAAVSRQREFLADASAVQFTRNPAGVGGALRKIGGYALGSSIAETRAQEIGHFFFAQGFRSFFGGLWATHPPLDERIRAVEPKWDGRLFEPPERVDIERETLAAAGHGPRVAAAAAAPARGPDAPPARIPFQASAVLAGIGSLTETQIEASHRLLEDLPEDLRAAARDSALAAPLVYALLAGPVGDGPNGAGAIVARHDSPAAAEAMRGLRPAAATVPAAAKLPLLQLALAPLRGLAGPALDRFAGTLDELVHADGRVSILEFALQKSVLNTLRRAAAPAAAPRFQSFQPLAPDFAVLLSALAHASPADSPRAFAHGLAQVPLLAGRIALQPTTACGLETLDEALDRLAAASLPIRRRALVAAAHVVGADGSVSTEEAELYRAVAAVLHCPAPAVNG
jgi:Zn-dependent protease with chaperone function